MLQGGTPWGRCEVAMANRTFYPSQSYGTSRVYAEFKFVGPGAGTSVAAANIDGCDLVASIAHVGGTNKFTITLKDPFNKVISHSADIVESTAGGAGNYATAGNFTNEGTATPLVFNVYAFTAAGAARNDPADTFVVSLALRNGSWGTK